LADKELLPPCDGPSLYDPLSSNFLFFTAPQKSRLDRRKNLPFRPRFHGLSEHPTTRSVHESHFLRRTPPQHKRDPPRLPQSRPVPFPRMALVFPSTRFWASPSPSPPQKNPCSVQLGLCRFFPPCCLSVLTLPHQVFGHWVPILRKVLRLLVTMVCGDPSLPPILLSPLISRHPLFPQTLLFTSSVCPSSSLFLDCTASFLIQTFKFYNERLICVRLLLVICGPRCPRGLVGG